MRRVYLIRHGRPKLPGPGKWCIGRTDIPLSPEGRLQACRAGEYLKNKNISAVFSSPLLRAKETAEALGRPFTVLEGLTEQYAGLWDGQSFDSIRRDWPDLYARRGADPALLPPGAESLEQCASRFQSALEQALESTEGDIAVFAHNTVIRSFLCRTENRPLSEFINFNIPFGSITAMTFDGTWKAEETGLCPEGEHT